MASLIPDRKSPSRVVVVQKSLPHYRKRFFELLRDRLRGSGVELVLVYGKPAGEAGMKADCVDVPGMVRIENKVLRLGRRELHWQPCLHLIRDADLVIVEQANKLLLNYWLILRRLWGRRRLAFWGHGKDFQARERFPVREFAKRALATRVDWWFAYNETSRRVVRSLGFPVERITNVQNAIDVSALIAARERCTPADVQAVRDRLGVRGDHVCIYSGGMYPEKRLEFLIEACQRLRHELPDFEVIFLGAGPDEHVVKRAARECPWAHVVGPKFGDDKVPYFMASKLLLMPGLVGLVVLDSFALETPLMTTAITYHSPEIEYLRDGINGVVVPDADDPAVYAAAVKELLLDDAKRSRLVDGCRASCDRYTVEQMAERFADGVMDALGTFGAGAPAVGPPESRRVGAFPCSS